MTREEYLKMEKEAQEKFEKMTPDEKEAFLAAKRRHSRKVRDEIITSHVIRERKKSESDKDKNNEDQS